MPSILFALVAILGIALPQCSRAEPDSVVVPNALMLKANYSFRITLGRGVAVCDAYLKRLTTAVFSEPPYCDIPESTSVSGFTQLKRIPLSPSQAEELWPTIYMFVTRQRELPPRKAWLPEESKIFADGAHWTREHLGQSVRPWKYEPAISLRNNGKPDNVLVWRDNVAFGDGNDFSKCGWIGTPMASESGYHERQLAFVLTPDDRTIDQVATRHFFGHPVDTPGPFPALGDQIGFFEFESTYYVEAFLGERVGEYLGNQHWSTEDTLAVYLTQGNETKEVCEYQMLIRPVN